MNVVYLGRQFDCEQTLDGEVYVLATDVPSAVLWCRRVESSVVRILCEQWPDPVAVHRQLVGQLDAARTKIHFCSIDAEMRRRLSAPPSVTRDWQEKFDAQPLAWRSVRGYDRQWKRALREHVQIGRGVLALYGPPGCGKSFALASVSGVGSRISCADFEDGHFEALEQWLVQRRKTCAILDDVELLSLGDRKKLCAVLERQEQHAVVVLDDLWSQHNRCWRKSARCAVPPVDDESLRNALYEVTGETHDAVVCVADGDARRAFLAARVGAECAGDARTPRAPVHARLRKLLRAPNVDETLSLCSTDSVDSVADLIYANAPAVVRQTARCAGDDLFVLESLARSLDAQSVGDVIQQMRVIANVDAYDTDEQIVCQLAVVAPLAALGGAVDPAKSVKLDFPLRRLAKAQKVRVDCDLEFHKAAILFGGCPTDIVVGAFAKSKRAEPAVCAMLARAAKVCGSEESFLKLAQRELRVELSSKHCGWHYRHCGASGKVN